MQRNRHIGFLDDAKDKNEMTVGGCLLEMESAIVVLQFCCRGKVDGDASRDIG